MRRNYNILWLDDKIESDISLKNRIIDKVRGHIKNDLAFEPNIIEEKEINKALDRCNASRTNQKIDLFVSDFNLIGDENGFNFLKTVRDNNYNQDLILYSNNSVDEITKSVIKRIEEENDLDIFSRFTFHSLNDRDEFIKTVNEIIDLNIEKWQELNALRGLYLSEISQLEMQIKDKIKAAVDLNKIVTITQRNINNLNSSLDKGQKSKLLNFIKKITDNKVNKLTFSEIKELLLDDSDSLHAEWAEIAEIRNSMAHISEDQDDLGRYICSCKDTTRKFYESDIIRYRQKLFNFLDDIKEILENLGL